VVLIRERVARWIGICGLLIAGAVGADGQTAAPQSGPGPVAEPVERVSWHGEVTGSSTLELVNPFGDLRLRYGGPGRAVEASVVLQQLDPAGSRLELEVETAADPAVIRIVRRDGGDRPPDRERTDRSRADVVVLVPDEVVVVARTTDGLLESTGLESDVDLATVDGRLRVRSTRGRVRAHSDRGAIEAVLSPGVTDAAQELSTVTGPIEVWVTDAGGFDVRMSTSGRLISDYSMQVEHHDREEPDKLATATVGSGGRPLALRSRRGDVSLRRLVTVEQLAVEPTTGSER
jgi:hypothetical protein